MKMLSKIYIPLTALFFALSISNAQEEWVAPDEFQEKLSPFEFDGPVKKEGKAIFIDNCKACHGDIGGNNPLGLIPSPGDPSSEKFQNNSDGSMFYKISEGRGSMTSFKNQLSAEEIWKVIGYIRTSHEGYTQQIAEVLEKKGYEGEIEILFAYLNAEKQIKATLHGKKGESIEPLSNIDVKMSADRYFGKLPFGPVKTTNSLGNVYFDVPEDVPGDSIGLVKVVAELSDIDLFGKIAQDTFLALGVATYKPSLVAERAMWNKVSKAPIWLLFSYGGGVVLAWGIIFYILLQLRTIFNIGVESEGKEK